MELILPYWLYLDYVEYEEEKQNNKRKRKEDLI